MKKSFSLFILVFAFTAGNCQKKLGMRSGANIATIKGLTLFPKNRLGWYAGLFFEQPLNSKFFMHLETLNVNYLRMLVPAWVNEIIEDESLYGNMETQFKIIDEYKATVKNDTIAKLLASIQGSKTLCK